VTFVAGVDIGNATTEIVIVDAESLRPVAWDRARTRGMKGSTEAWRGAGRVLTRLQSRLGIPVDVAIGTHQWPVLTRRLDLPTVPVATGRLKVVATGSSTPGGSGYAVGHPIDLASSVDASVLAATGTSVIAVSRDPLGYLRTVDTLHRWLEAGIDVRGVLLAGDEASLVARRLHRRLPIVDGVDVPIALAADLVALEVAEPGRTCREVTDPLRLVATLGLGTDEHPHAGAIAAGLVGQRSAAVAILGGAVPNLGSPPTAAVELSDGSSHPLARAAAAIEAGPATVVGYLDDQGVITPVTDLWLVDPAALAAVPGLRQPGELLNRVALSTMDRDTHQADDLHGVHSTWSGAVRLVGSEPLAALRGALSTPGVNPDALVVDLGGGTIDLVHAHWPGWTGAGSGDLMTTATAIATNSSRAAAEWVKRGPAWRIETPHLAVDESGDRRFLDVPAAQGSVGWLVTGGPSGELPFSRHLTGGEWRSMRLALKEQVFGRNTKRGLRAHPGLVPSEVVLVGGPAGDDEIVEAMTAGLGRSGSGTSIGRANVAGVLGHRWAVAYGLVLLDLDRGQGD